MIKQLLDSHDRSRLQFDKLAEAREMLDKARVELTTLSKLGDLISQEDVIRGAGKLVAAGLSPMAVAKLLSDMPEKGEELQGWVEAHVQALGQREAQLDPVLDSARAQMGTAALRVLTAHQLGMEGGDLAPDSTPGPAGAGNSVGAPAGAGENPFGASAPAPAAGGVSPSALPAPFGGSLAAPQ